MAAPETNSALALLKGRLATVSDLRGAYSLLSWDRQTCMPAGGVAARAEQMATLSQLAHEMLAAKETRRLLDLAGEPEPDSVDFAFLRLARREHERAVTLPPSLVQQLARAAGLAAPAWEQARADSDWSAFAPHLQRIVALRRETAEYLGYEDHPYDALLDLFEPGAKKARLEEMFRELAASLVPMIRTVCAMPDTDRSRPLHGEFAPERQDEFGRKVVSAFGYDWSRGRQDHAVHPFCSSPGGPGDVRITTRLDPGHLSPALFATFHEAGHAIYEQGVDPAYNRTPLSGGVSMGVHESQSRLWENVVGRSRAFWSHFYPELQRTFPAALGDTGLEEFYRAVNEVRPSEIRVEADELTYDLHILMRFDLEAALVEGSLEVADLPAAWSAKTEEYLGVTPKNDANGVLQDVHWSLGHFGYFPSYTIGNVLSAQLYDEAAKQHPEIPREIGQGEFHTLRAWLWENIHRHGSRYDPDELIGRITGGPLEIAPYLRYLQRKFGELYSAGSGGTLSSGFSG